ncbi:MAG: endo alpha-1,4 polygalactosaminidase [Micromonosporaceae bacterium]
MNVVASPSASRPAGDGGAGGPGNSAPRIPPATPREVTSWVYQLQEYPGGRLDKLAASPHQLVVIDLARDASTSYFTRTEVGELQRRGKRVLAYFEIGSIEDFRPEYRAVRDRKLTLNEWSDWPGEYFVRYWERSWWDLAVKPRLDQAIAAGFDGVYLDTPLAYEEIDLKLVPGETRETLGRKMVELIVKISRYAKSARQGFWVFPQNSPELARYPGYTGAIDGIGMEELFFLATDEACTEDFCAENLAATRGLREAGKLVLAVDYAEGPGNRAAACRRYRQERFVGYVTGVDLDDIRPHC